MREMFQTSLALAKAKFKEKNQGNYLGVLWYLLDPLLFFLIFVLVRNVTGAGVEHYPIYLLIGLVMFNFFRSMTNDATRVITSNSNLITQLKIKQEVFILSAFFNVLFEHLFEVLVLFGALIFYGLPVWYMIFYPLVFAVLSVFCLGVSFFLASVSVYINDLANVWSLFTRLLFFATPIFYGVSRVNLSFDINKLNPLYYFISITRDVVIYHKFPEMWIMAASIGVSIAAFVIGFFVFEKTKLSIAEKL